MTEKVGPGTVLAIAGLGACFVSRPLAAAGAPAIVKFAHFALIVGAIFLILPRISTPVGHRLVRGLALLAGAIGLSALANGAGVVNAVLDFLLLSEPFLLILLMTASLREASAPSVTRRWIYAFGLLNLAFAGYQSLIQGLGGDDVRGLFLEQGAGAHVAGAVAMTFGAAVLASRRGESVWVKALLLGACLCVVKFTDSKQVLAVFVVSLFLVATIRIRHLGYVFRMAAVGAIAVGGLFVAAYTVMPALQTWADPDVVAEGLEHKLSVFSVLRTQGPDWWHPLVGLGPGHSVGRLASLLPEYSEALQPAGATISSATASILDTNQSHRLGGSGGSSMWSMFFFWAGLIGDLGLLGLLVFVRLWLIVWRSVGNDGLGRFLVINVFVFGAVFSWLEEPGYMLFVAALLGLSWKERIAGLAEQANAVSRASEGLSSREPWRQPSGWSIGAIRA